MVGMDGGQAGRTGERAARAQEITYAEVERRGGFPGGTVVKNLLANVGDAGDAGSIPGTGRAPEEGVATHSSVLPGKFHGQRSLVGYSPWGFKGSDMTERLSTLQRGEDGSRGW